MSQSSVSDVVYVLLAMASAATAVANPAVSTLAAVMAAIAAAVARLGGRPKLLAWSGALASVIGSGVAFSYVSGGAHYVLIGSYITTLASILLAYSVVTLFGGRAELKLLIIGASLVLASFLLIPVSLPPADVASIATPGISAVLAYSPALALAAAGNMFTALAIAMTAKPRPR